MQVSILGIIFHEFDVGFTDILLFLACSYFLYKLIKHNSQKESIYIFTGLAFSSLFGAFFHFFFPLKATTFAGMVMWSSVAISIGLIIFGILNLCIEQFFQQKSVYKLLVYVYLTIYFLYFFFFSHAYLTIIIFYGPSLLLLGLVAMYNYLKMDKKSIYLLIGVILSFFAAYIQVSKISINEVYFNYNSLYHIIQLIGIYYFYIYFKSVSVLKLK